MHKAKQELSYFNIDVRKMLGCLLLAAAIGSATVVYNTSTEQILKQDNQTVIHEQTHVVIEPVPAPAVTEVVTSDRTIYEVASGDTVWNIARKLKPGNTTLLDYANALMHLNGINASKPHLTIGASINVPNSRDIKGIVLPTIKVKFNLDDPELIRFIKEAEGTAEVQQVLKRKLLNGKIGPSFRNGKFYPYKDPHGYYTIGYGSLISKTSAKAQKYKNGITKQEADKLLRSDMERVYDEFVLLLQKKNAVGLPREVQMALYEMTYNMGSGSLAEFNRMWKNISKGRYVRAGKELKNSAWSSQVQKERVQRLTAMISMKDFS